MRFWLGTHEPTWLGRLDLPLFVSHTRIALRCRRKLPRAIGPWALDSGAFGEVGVRGDFDTTPVEYVRAVRRYRDEIGNLAWASQQDHMCEAPVLARSRLASTVAQAQRWTVDNLLTLRTLDPTLPIIPVLQGQTRDDYLRCVDMYDHAGVDLSMEPLIGLGSVCRRQRTAEIGEVIASLDGFPLHGFGVKSGGIERYGWMLASADSLAWSDAARHREGSCGRIKRNGEPVVSCNNCMHFALEWRDRTLRSTVDRAPVQMTLG